MQIEIPKNCPCCDFSLEFVNDQLFCRNPACSAQVNKKIEHFCKALGLKGFGSKTIEKLSLEDITDLFSLDFDTMSTLLGSEKVADKLLAEINRAKYADLATVLASFSIPLVGTTASKKIAAVVSDVDEITQDACKAAGLGEKVTANLLQFLQFDLPQMRPFLPFSFTSDKEVVVLSIAASVCITGKLKTFKNKAEATAALVAAGYSVVESVTKATNYLVDEGDSSSAKRIKAESLGIPIIDNIQTFLEENIND
jgi:NAD-dependent DNA ligase